MEHQSCQESSMAFKNKLKIPISGKLCPYVHCHVHWLNSILVDVPRKIQDLHEIISILKAIYGFQSLSTVNHQIFIGKTGGKIPMHCDTRWVSKFKSIRHFQQNFGTVLLTLQECLKSVKI